jgi:hypothetical protein
MRFFQLPACTYFVLINPYVPSLLLVKDSHGKVRRYLTYEVEENFQIAEDTEVQIVILKPSAN